MARGVRTSEAGGALANARARDFSLLSRAIRDGTLDTSRRVHPRSIPSAPARNSVTVSGASGRASKYSSPRPLIRAARERRICTVRAIAPPKTRFHCTPCIVLPTRVSAERRGGRGLVAIQHSAIERRQNGMNSSSKRGFAAMKPEDRKAIASKGRRASHASGKVMNRRPRKHEAGDGALGVAARSPTACRCVIALARQWPTLPW